MSNTPQRTPLVPDPKARPPCAAWEERERAQLRAKMADPAHSYERDGVLYWRANGAVIPPHVFKDAGLVCPPAQEAARDRELGEFKRRYIEAQRNNPPSPGAEAEQRYEMRAAFGRGRTVVDIISGKRYRT